VDVIASSTGAVQKDGIENAVGAMMDSKQVNKLLLAVQQAESNRSTWIKQARENADKQAKLTQQALESHEQVMLDQRLKAAKTELVLNVVAVEEPARELVQVEEEGVVAKKAARATGTSSTGPGVGKPRV